MSKMHATVEAVTSRIIERSKPGRQAYLDLIAKQRDIKVFERQFECEFFGHDLPRHRLKPAVDANCFCPRIN